VPLLAAKRRSRSCRDGYRGFQLPNDVGSSVVRAIDVVFRKALVDPKTDRVWLVRASASLFGSILAARIGASWEEPRGNPIFLGLLSGRPLPVLISPLRLSLDAVWHRGPVFTETYESLFRFREGRGPMPQHVFRLDPMTMDVELRVTWQWAWSLVATCGTFHGSGWDLNFSLSSLSRLGEILARSETTLADRGRMGVLSVDRDPGRRQAWLARATRAYLGETLRTHLGARWQPPEDPRDVARNIQFPKAPELLDTAAWVEMIQRRGEASFLPELGRRLASFVHADGPWPSL